ncbi:unnamed protein product [Discula destructiva]
MSSPAEHIHPLYRLWHLYIEPFGAFYGAVLCARSPLLYLSVMSPRANRAHYHPEVQIVFDQLAATYLLFAFNQAVVLRMADGSLRVWRGLLAGMLLCDLVHIWASTKALGGLAVLADPVQWRLYDWVNVVMLLIPMVLRISFLAGVGVREEAEGKALAGASGRQTRSKTKTG